MISDKKKSLATAILVLGLETYNYVVFMFLARGMITPFSVNPSTSREFFFDLILGFIARPLGGLLFGRLADKVGRKKLFVLTAFLMGLATFCLSVVPFDKGAVARYSIYFLIFLRTMQGMIYGADFALTGSYLIEMAPKNKRGFYTSLTSIGLEIGDILGVLVTLSMLFIPQELMGSSFGWRIPFISGSLSMLVGMHLRSTLQESTKFHTPRASFEPIRELFFNYKKDLLKVLFIIPLEGITFTFLRGYILNTSMDIGSISVLSYMVLSILASIVNLVFSLIGGYLSDIVGRKPVLISASIAMLLLSWPLFVLMIHPGAPEMMFIRLCVGQIILGMFGGLYFGALYPTVAETFANKIRITGFSFIYNLSLSFMTGEYLLSKVYNTLNSRGNSFPSLYMVMWALVSILVISFGFKETYREELK